MRPEGPYVVNQHYIPRCILRHFKESDDTYNEKQRRIFHTIHLGRKEVFPSTLERVMSGKYFYEHPNFARNQFEGQLQKLESWYGSKIRELIELISLYEERAVKFSKVKTKAFSLIKGMIMMHLRSGAMMYELRFWEQGQRSLDSIYRMLRRIGDRGYIEEFARTLLTFHEFCILKSSNRDFLISDQFLVSASLTFKARFTNATNRTIGMRDVIIILPVTKSYYLCFWHGNHQPDYIRPNQFRYLTPGQTDEINKMIMNNSYLQTAGPSSETLNRVLREYRDRSPTGVYFGGERGHGGSELRKEVFFYERDEAILRFVEFSITKYREFKNLKKNSLCLCGSGKVFGDCCRYKLRAFEKMMNTIKIQSEDRRFDPHTIPGCIFHERNILDFFSREKR